MTDRELLRTGLNEYLSEVCASWASQSVRLQRTTYCVIPRFCVRKTRL